MIISSGMKKWVFIAVSKTGTGSIQRYFRNEQPFISELVMDLSFDGYHQTISEVFTKYPHLFVNNAANNYFKWCVHRNPWDRVVSCFLDFKTHRSTNPATNNFVKHLVPYNNFSDFVLDFKSNPATENIRFAPTTKYVTHQGINQMDQIINYETFSTGLKDVFSMIGQDFSRFPINKKIRASDRSGHYKQYYKFDSMIDIIGDHFHEDIIAFGDRY